MQRPRPVWGGRLSLRETINGTTLADRVLLVFLLLVSFLGIFFIKDVLPKGRDVVIEVEGRVEYKYPIDSDKVIRVKSSYGQLAVEIKDHRVRVVDASCPNKLCEHQGWITRGAIICLPSSISVLVGNPEKSNDRSVDATTG